ncbi:hypothetical protein [Hathewaya massiliensis]|uniref:hypothetical protein n=1 Tax=Hathewaya massiliensis TaxID=1964382 RepID=UPI00115B218A|nr:hypothetical protein [Hathewaya massiliensis]
MGKKSTKVLSGALATTSLLGGVMGAVPAFAATNVDAMYKSAFDAVMKAKEDKSQESIIAARKAINELTKHKELKGFVGEFSKQTDAVQQKLFEDFYSLLFVDGKKKDKISQGDVNKAREFVTAFDTFEGNKQYTASWSTAVDGFQQVLVVEANDAVVKAMTSKDEKDIKVAQELVKALATSTNADAKKEATKYNAILEVIDSKLVVNSINAINSTEAEVTFNKEVKEVKPANFKVTDKNGNLVFVSKVELSKDKKVATLTFFDKFADKGVYNVETSELEDVKGNKMDKATNSFVYLAADAAKVEFVSTTIAKDKTLDVKVTDKLGRDISKEVKIEFETSNATVINVDGKSVNEGSAIVVAKVKVGDAYIKTPQTTIKVNDKKASSFVGYYVYTGIAAENTDKFVELKEKSIETEMENTANKLALYYKDQYGQGVSSVTTFNGINNNAVAELTNLTPNIVIVENDGTIKPISVGEGYVKVVNGDVAQTIKITVKEKSKVASMQLEKSEVSIVNKDGVKTADINIKYKNQFGKEVENPSATAAVSVKSEDEKIATVQVDAKKVVKVTAVKEGSTTIEVNFKDGDLTVKQTLKVVVVKAGELSNYKVEAGTTKLDKGNINGDKEKLPVSTKVSVSEIDDKGNLIGKPNNVAFVEVDKDGKVLEADKQLLTINQANGEVKADKAGTTYVQVKVGTLVVNTLQFEVVNSASEATSVKFTNFALPALKTGENLKAKILENVKVYDQFGKAVDNVVLSIPDGGCYITNTTNGFKAEDPQGNLVVTDRTKDATADIVITKIVENGQVKNLLSSPVVVKAVIKGIAQ